MLSTTLAEFQTTFPVLAYDGSNWIIWKHRIQILLGAVRLDHIIDDSTVPPSKPEPLADTTTVAEVAAFNTASEKYSGFKMHLIVSAISDDVLIKNIRHTTGRSLWKAIYDD